jgi:peptide/nickel transport system permease protein
VSAQPVAGLPRPQRLAGRLAGTDATVAVAVAIAALLVVAAVLAPLLAPHDPEAVDPINVFAGASGAHPLGTDDTGRDILSRLIYGARPSLAAPAAIMLVAGVAGTLLAVSAAWFGGWWDALVSRFLDLLFALPGLVLAIVAAAVFGSGLLAPVAALAIAYVPYVARVLRSAAMRERRLPYVEALLMQGLSPWAICRRHLLPNLAPLLVVQVAVGFGYAMLDVAAVSFLGLGIQPPTAEWGLMVANGKPAIIDGHTAESLYAGLVIVLAVVSFNVLGERLSQRLLGDRG